MLLTKTMSSNGFNTTTNCSVINCTRSDVYIVGKQQLNYWKAKNCHVFLSQISPRIKKDSQRASSVRLSTSSKKVVGIDRQGSSGAPTKQHSSIISCCITIARPGRQAHTAQGSREGRRFLGTETGGGYGTHHIEAVIIGGKARRRIHARVLLLQNGRQRARRRDTKAGWLQCRAGLERSCIGLATGGMNECLQAVCDAIECLCRPGHGMAMTLDEDLTSIQLDCSWELCCFAYDNN